ncbi:unnamed protein product [Ilex paraguariensis]|uniref:Uncharacterized protein n=1 Tax=Ilex paraguariensis TaxID=185542 RepID=A0ABC8R3D0_9AQUA
MAVGGSNPFKGDMLVIAGSMLYAISNVSEISGSTMLNLSLLTSDMWAVLIRIFAYHEKVSGTINLKYFTTKDDVVWNQHCPSEVNIFSSG